ncbi:hypothetical protein CURTO8I2_250200 [Curtobacterium sp. 8I-2]|nr:hypothetical protein CURTO8I2_250200 [Curtobacterium sp. 8I-2]
MVAHLTGGQGVAGSNPVSPTETCLTQRKKPTEDLGGLLPLGSTSSRRAGARNNETTGPSVRVEQ